MLLQSDTDRHYNSRNAGWCIGNASFLNSALCLWRALWAQAKCTGSLKSWPVCQTFFLVVCIVCVCAKQLRCPVKLFLAQQAWPEVLFLAASGLPWKWCPSWRVGQSWGRFVFAWSNRELFWPAPNSVQPAKCSWIYCIHRGRRALVDWEFEPKPQLLFSVLLSLLVA